MRYGSVCSGIEAATVAWHPLGWEPAWFAEIEDFPSRVLAHHYPHVRNYGDFTTIPAGAGPIDLLVGGTPCQSFSVAGLRGGLEDERGNLALEYCRLAARLRPRWVVWENVPGVLSSWTGPKPPRDLEPGQQWEATETSDFGSLCAGLADLGYGLAYRVLDAQFFGVPQRRRRVFLVGYLGDWRRAAAVLFEPESLRGNPPAKRTAGQAAALDAGNGAEGGNRRSAALTGNAYADRAGEEANLVPSVAGTLNANGKAAGSATQQDAEAGMLVPLIAGTLGGGSGSRGWACDTDRMTFIPQTITGPVTHTLRADGFDASEDGTGRGNDRRAAPIAFDTTQITSQTNRSQPAPGRPCHPLAAAAHPPAVAMTRAVRRLTPRECERLQGFPDDYTAIPGGTRVSKAKIEADYVKYMSRGGTLSLEQALQLVADGPRYRALGNSMAVPVMAWLGRRIERVERIK
jgi:DNA (cytosine-5)-methyltransferase 1